MSPGTAVRVVFNPRFFDQKYINRSGVVVRANRLDPTCVYVDLAPTKRAKARRQTFNVAELVEESN